MCKLVNDLDLYILLFDPLRQFIIVRLSCKSNIEALTNITYRAARANYLIFYAKFSWCSWCWEWNWRRKQESNIFVRDLTYLDQHTRQYFSLSCSGSCPLNESDRTQNLCSPCMLIRWMWFREPNGSSADLFENKVRWFCFLVFFEVRTCGLRRTVDVPVENKVQKFMCSKSLVSEPE